jgi:hypothetical protein
MGTTITSGCPKGSWRAKRSTAFSRLSMSSWPGRKIRTSPGGWSIWIWKNVRSAAST